MAVSGSRGKELEPTHGVYPMSVATDLTGMHAQTLRKYEREGLLEPARTDGGSRRFSANDVGRLHRIGELADQGVNVEGIRRILTLEERVQALEQRITHLEAHLQLGSDPKPPRVAQKAPRVGSQVARKRK